MDTNNAGTMATMTSLLQSLPATAKTVAGSDVNMHISYIHSNINGYDQSKLSEIDPNIHHNNLADSQYYNENNFNTVFKQSNELSIIHLNIRSVPANFSQLRAQLDTLYVNFKIIALSETAINIVTIHVIIFQVILLNRILDPNVSVAE